MKIWEHVNLTYICRLYSLQVPAGPHFVTQPILLSENIPNIWHKSSIKHKEVRPDWNDKSDNANFTSSYHMEGYQWLRLPFLKKYSIKCEKI